MYSAETEKRITVHPNYLQEIIVLQSIYALTEPDDGTVPRYIGRSTNVVARYGTHLNGGSSRYSNEPFCAWLKACKRMGKTPGLLILETDVDDAHASEREKHWIQHYMLQGSPLLNVIHNAIAERVIQEELRIRRSETSITVKFKIEDFAWQKHMRKTDLAAATGLRWATIHKYWANVDIRRPDMIVLEKIAKALGVTVNDLIDREEDKSVA